MNKNKKSDPKIVVVCIIGLMLLLLLSLSAMRPKAPASRAADTLVFVVGAEGLEPATSAL